MKYLDRLPTEPAVWLLVFMLAAIVGSLLYMVLSSIRYRRRLAGRPAQPGSPGGLRRPSRNEWLRARIDVPIAPTGR